jgi:hypothetical protein
VNFVCRSCFFLSIKCEGKSKVNASLLYLKSDANTEKDDQCEQHESVLVYTQLVFVVF